MELPVQKISTKATIQGHGLPYYDVEYPLLEMNGRKGCYDAGRREQRDL